MLNATNDGVIMEGRRVEQPGQMSSLQNNRYLNHREHGYTGSSRAMAGERLVGSVYNLSYAEQVWTPNNTGSIPITQTYFHHIFLKINTLSHTRGSSTPTTTAVESQ